MMEEDACIDENRGLLQDFLPGVTLHNGLAPYHQRSDSFSHQSQVSRVMRKMSSDDYNEYSTVYSSVSSKKGSVTTEMEDFPAIQFLLIDRDNNSDHFSDSDELDDAESFPVYDAESFPVSIHRAAVVSEAKRRSEERWVLQFKWILVATLCFLLWNKFED